MNRPEKEHTPLEGMDNEQIKRFALFLLEENHSKSKQLDEMIARLDEIGIDLKESNKKIDSLTNALLKANSKADKVVLEYKPVSYTHLSSLSSGLSCCMHSTNKSDDEVGQGGTFLYGTAIPAAYHLFHRGVIVGSGHSL